MSLLPEEMATEGSVCCSRYEYVPTGKFLSNGQEKKIALVQKETPPSELFKYLGKNEHLAGLKRASLKGKPSDSSEQTLPK